MPPYPKICVSVISVSFVKNNFFLDKYVAIYGTHLKKKPAKCWVWNVALFGAETCTLRKADQKYLESYGVLCWRRKEMIVWSHCVKNEEVLHRVKEKRNILNKSLLSHRACCHTCYTIQLMHYSQFKTQSLQHLKPIKCWSDCVLKCV